MYALCGLFARSPLKVDIRYQHVLVWGGLRGALALALAVPDSITEKAAVITAAFAVVGLSIFVQGLTMPRLIRILGVMRKADQHRTAAAFPRTLGETPHAVFAHG